MGGGAWQATVHGIAELDTTELLHFHHYIYYCGQESLRRNGIAIIVNKRESEMQYIDAISKMTE